MFGLAATIFVFRFGLSLATSLSALRGGTSRFIGL